MRRLTIYRNHKGGINNLQVVQVLKRGLVIKIFTSLKHLAEARADKFIKNYERSKIK